MKFGSLFTGIGGLDLALERCGLICAWQVEIEPFCRRVLARHWPQVPQYADIRQLRGEDIEPVELIAGGYPCQPFSQAGKRRGAADPRHLWPEFARLLGELRPRYAFLENVSGHLSLGFGEVLADLARLGYDAEWTLVSAAETGAPHLRQRLFCLAYRDGGGRRERGIERRPPGHAELCGPALAHAPSSRRAPRECGENREIRQEGRRPQSDRRSHAVSDAGGQRCEGPERKPEVSESAQQFFSPYPPPPNDYQAWERILSLDPWSAPALEAPPQSQLRRMADELPAPMVAAMTARRARLRALGNAVVPAQGALAFRELWQRIQADREETEQP